MADPTRQIRNRYKLQEIIGQGGMGEVYRGLDTHTGQWVAIKFLRPDRAASHPDQLERFVRESEALRQLDHPNIVKMLATGEENTQRYLIMEYVSGGSLRDVLDQQPQLPVEQTLSIALELADALTRAHHLNIIHRDLKPANVLLADDDTPRLTDFGTAYLAGTTRFTQAGTLIGTPHYLSPEAINQKPLDGRADIWAFGVMLFEMLAGHCPFGGDTLTSLAMAILQHPIPDLRGLCPDAGSALTDLVHRMLERDRDQRVPSARVIGAELEAIIQGKDRTAQVIQRYHKANHRCRIPS